MSWGYFKKSGYPSFQLVSMFVFSWGLWKGSWAFLYSFFFFSFLFLLHADLVLRKTANRLFVYGFWWADARKQGWLDMRAV